MIKLMRELLVIAMLGVVSAGAFAQKKDRGDKRPPKDKLIVVTNDNKGNRPPPRNDNKKPKPDKRGRP